HIPILRPFHPLLFIYPTYIHVSSTTPKSYAERRGPLLLAVNIRLPSNIPHTYHALLPTCILQATCILQHQQQHLQTYATAVHYKKRDSLCPHMSTVSSCVIPRVSCDPQQRRI
ncbi:unnamed protein product, partial [Ectocarpus sp. 12 AP-2014]